MSALTTCLERLIALNLFLAIVLFIGGDTQTALLGLIGAGAFAAALVVREVGDA